MNTDTYIIIPVYNEAKVITSVVNKVSKYFKNIVCINDGSSDGTATAIQKTKATLINHPINLGQGASLQTGIEYALQDPKAKYFVTFDADGQHRIEDVKKMLDYIRFHKIDIVTGSRFLGKAINMSFIKKLVLKLAIQFSNIISGLKLTDTHNGLRVFNRHVAETLNITFPDMSHASEIVNTIAANNYKYAELPVTITYTEYSKKKGQSVFNAINISFDILHHKASKKW